MAPDSKRGGMDKKRGPVFGNNRRPKKRDMGRSEWAKTKVDKRSRNEGENATKRRRLENGEQELPVYATQFSKEDIDAEGRRPKKKVAVMIGYSGSGYKGMQMCHDQKTIEGDLFKAFVAAGAISKANADDPKKSSFVRCARTDKGVHAAGNVISLKLIVEDEDIVQRINDNLSPQIRVWGYERTNNSFSAYQLCDSRIYEFLIPTHCFLPPHPSSFLGQKIVELAEQTGDLENHKERQKEVEGFWEAIDEEVIKPILNSYDEATRAILVKALYPREGDLEADMDDELPNDEGETTKDVVESEAQAAKNIQVTAPLNSTDTATGQSSDSQAASTVQEDVASLDQKASINNTDGEPITEAAAGSSRSKDPRRDPVIAEAIKTLRSAYIAAKRAYRISPERLERVTDIFTRYHGHKRFHNYTIGKGFRDPSASRYIKSFVVNQTPIIINGTEWLSLKVHGQSFMMHQIRKMVGMAALIVRCGCDSKRIDESYGHAKLSIPKAPGLGLLLERPVFDSYNKRAREDLGREPVDFDKYEKEMLEFKQREIYERIYREEDKENIFGNFFNHIDNFSSEAFLFVTSGGIAATEQPLSATTTAKSKRSEAALEAAGLGSEGEDDAADANTKEAEG